MRSCPGTGTGPDGGTPGERDKAPDPHGRPPWPLPATTLTPGRGTPTLMNNHTTGACDCAETGFRTSSHSGASGECVEVANTPRGACVRDSKHPHLGHLPINAREWEAFLLACS